MCYILINKWKIVVNKYFAQCISKFGGVQSYLDQFPLAITSLDQYEV